MEVIYLDELMRAAEKNFHYGEMVRLKYLLEQVMKHEEYNMKEEENENEYGA